MRDLKIGKLIFKKKALLIILFCLFLNVINIGLMVACFSNKNFTLFYAAFFIPYLLFFKTIKNNVIEIK